MQNAIIEENIIGIKELHANMRNIAKRAKNGEIFVVFKNSSPMFRISPYKHVKKIEKYNFAEIFQDCMFSSDDTDLSKKIDEIAWGV